MIHPDVELRFLRDEVGYGLVAKRFIPKGTFTWVQCALEQVFDASTYAAFPAAYRPYLEKYTYSTRSGDRILCCDIGRYINHSCEPNTLTLPEAEVEVAVRDIFPGDEVTDDYGTLNLTHPLVCCCGARRCRGVIRGDDSARLQPLWERAVAEARRHSEACEQPLAGYLGACCSPDASQRRS